MLDPELGTDIVVETLFPDTFSWGVVCGCMVVVAVVATVVIVEVAEVVEEIAFVEGGARPSPAL